MAVPVVKPNNPEAALEAAVAAATAEGGAGSTTAAGGAAAAADEGENAKWTKPVVFHLVERGRMVEGAVWRLAAREIMCLKAARPIPRNPQRGSF